MAYYNTCLCNATTEAGSTTTAERKLEHCEKAKREQLYYTEYNAAEEPSEVSPIYPTSHASVIWYKDTGNSVQEVIESMKGDIANLKTALQSKGKFHLRIADDCITDSGVIALSARQGMKLNEQLSKVRNNAYSRMFPVDDDGYLYSVAYEDYKLSSGTDYFKNTFGFIPAGCSAIKVGSVVGHNYDGVYDEYVDFLVNTPHVSGHNADTGTDVRYATIGIASKVYGMKNDDVKASYKNGTYNSIFEALPYAIVEGMNEKGVVCTLNTVIADKGACTEGVSAEEEDRIRLYVNMLPRYILDYFATAEDAVDYIKKYVSLVIPTSTLIAGYDYHITVSDATKSYLIEWWDGEYHVKEQSVVTNFYINDVELNNDGTVYTPADVCKTPPHTASENGIENHGIGLERYNLILDKKSAITSAETMLEFLKKLNYSNVYAQHVYFDGAEVPYWYTEFVEGDLTVNSSSATTAWYTKRDKQIEKFENKDRNEASKNYGTWQTVHSVVFDIANKKIYLVCQENTTTYNFEFDDATVALNALQSQIEAINARLTAANL